MKGFSKITVGLGIFIIISASFMLQVNDFLTEAFGKEAVRSSFFVLFFLITALYIGYIIYKRIPVYRIGLSLLGFGLAYLLISWQPYFAEKLHIIEYGILGYLALKDLFGMDRQVSRNIIYALCFVALIGSLDEGFQRVLSYRVFEVRDIVTNIVSGALGIIQFLIYRRHMV